MEISKIKCSNPDCDYMFDPDYEGRACGLCGKVFCPSCVETELIDCDNCGITGCRDCIKQDKETGFYYCSEECLFALGRLAIEDFFEAELKPEELKPKLKVYLSHPIMGIKGVKATEKEIKANVEKAIRMVNKIRTMFPELDVYCPAEHEAFVHLAYKLNKLSIDDILKIDCQLIKDCKLLLAYNWQYVLSNGMITEVEFASKNNIPIITFRDASTFTMRQIRFFIDTYKGG